MRTFLLLLVVALAAGLVAWWLAEPHAGRTEGGAQDPPSSTPTPAAETGDFVGAEACRECHPHEVAAWEASHHAPVVRRVEQPGLPGEVAVGSRWMQAYVAPDARGFHRIQRLCLDLRDGQWRPVIDVLAEISGTNPGPAPPSLAAVRQRSFETDCAGCHASVTRLRFDGRTGRLESSWRGIAADCETCHGPSRAHVEAEDPRGTLERLETLPPRTANAVCGRCHGGQLTVGEYGVEDAKHFVAPLGGEEGFFPNGVASGQRYEYAGFLASPCNTKGGLTCADCHEPHGLTLRGAVPIEATCLGCHPGLDAYEHTRHDPEGEGARCVACHLPTLLGGFLFEQHDHRIGVPLPQSPHVPDACTHCHDDKDKAWAAQAWREWWGEPPRDMLDAIELVVAARDEDPADPRNAARYGSLFTHRDPYFRATVALHTGDVDRVRSDPLPEVRQAAVLGARARSREDALRLALEDAHPVIRATAYVALGDGRPPMTPAWRADLTIFVRQARDATEARVLLGRHLLELGEVAEAAKWFEQAVVFEPDSADVWSGLAEAYALLGRAGELAKARRRWEAAKDG